jgi:hypothetical protein
VDKMSLRQVSSEHFGFPYQFSFHKLVTLNYHPWLVQNTNWTTQATPPHKIKEEKRRESSTQQCFSRYWSVHGDMAVSE